MGAAELVQDFDFPRVSGRHRNRPLASQRRSAALKLVSNGMTYQQAADHLGYRNRGTVHRIVQRALQTTEVASVQDSRAQALERLESLLSAAWEPATSGDLPAGRMVLRIIEAECRLLGLYTPPAGMTGPEADWPCCQGPGTVVIRADDCRYAGCERHGQFQDRLGQ